MDRMFSYVRARLDRIDNSYSRILHISLEAFEHVLLVHFSGAVLLISQRIAIVRIEGTEIEQIWRKIINNSDGTGKGGAKLQLKAKLWHCFRARMFGNSVARNLSINATEVSRGRACLSIKDCASNQETLLHCCTDPAREERKWLSR